MLTDLHDLLLELLYLLLHFRLCLCFTCILSNFELLDESCIEVLQELFFIIGESEALLDNAE